MPTTRPYNLLRQGCFYTGYQETSLSKVYFHHLLWTTSCFYLASHKCRGKGQAATPEAHAPLPAWRPDLTQQWFTDINHMAQHAESNVANRLGTEGANL